RRCILCRSWRNSHSASSTLYTRQLTMFSHRVDDEVELFLLMPHHSEALFELVEANRESWGEWLGWVAGVTDVEAMRDFITRGLERFARQESIYLGIRYKGKFVGRAAFGSIDLDYARKLD